MNRQRLLGSLEKRFWLLDRAAATHIVMAAEIEGAGPEHAWQDALLAAQARHPLLRVCITVNDDGEPEFTPYGDRTIPFHVLNLSSDHDLSDFMASELSTPFDLAGKPLARAALLRDAQRSFLILCAHHAIADGMSMAFVVRDLVKASAGRLIDPLHMPQSIDVLAGFRPHRFSTDRRPAEREVDDIVDSGDRGGVLPVVERSRFTTAFTRMLRDRCRKENTTVHGALCAAFAKAGHDIHEDWRASAARVVSPVNARGVVGVQDDLGLYISSKLLELEPAADSDFWSLARFARQGLINESSRERVTALTAGLRTLLATCDLRTATRKLSEGRARDLMLTNIGQIPFECDFGAVRISAVWGPLALSGYPGEYTVGIATTHGALSITTATRRPTRGLLDTAKDILNSAVIGKESP